MQSFCSQPTNVRSNDCICRLMWTIDVCHISFAFHGMSLVLLYISERIAKEKEEEERHRLEEMSEDEYDALTEKEKAEVDRKRLEIKKERIRK